MTETLYERLIAKVISFVEAARIPRYLSRTKNNIFDVRQHIALQVLQRYENKPLRKFVEWLAISRIPDLLGLPRIPHFDALNKFALRVKPMWLDAIIARIAMSICGEFRLGIDSTGFQPTNSSAYYRSRTGRPIKHFTKLSGAVELNTKLLVAVKVRKLRIHDNKDFIPLLNKVRKHGRIRAVLADAAYDSEANLTFVRTELLASPIIAMKYAEKPLAKTKGFYRKRLKRAWPLLKPYYGKRALTETAWSVLKRCYGSALQSRSFRGQKAELLFKVIAYDAERAARFFVFKLTFDKAE